MKGLQGGVTFKCKAQNSKTIMAMLSKAKKIWKLKNDMESDFVAYFLFNIIPIKPFSLNRLLS